MAIFHRLGWMKPREDKQNPISKTTQIKLVQLVPRFSSSHLTVQYTVNGHKKKQLKKNPKT